MRRGAFILRLLGGWAALLAAAARHPDGCGVPTRLSFAELRNEYKNMNHFTTGAIAKYTCRPGYTRHPRMSPSVTCLENGRWSEASEFCKKKSCGHPGELENGRISLNDNLFGSTVNFTCEEGHRMIGRPFRRCELSGLRVAWSGDLPFCERIPCHPPPDIPNGRHNGVLMDDFSYGSAVTYQCDKGYPPTGETSIYCTTKDGLNGVWSARPPWCGEVRCPAPHIPNGRKVSGNKNIYSYKDNVTFECDPGYKMKGPRVSQCQTDQTWDPPVPVCERVEQCRSPPRIMNGRLSGQVSDVFTSGMSVKYQCNPGYFLVGEASLHCTASGAWSNPFPQCEARCVNPELENGKTNGALAPYRPGDVAVFKCEHGYTLHGSAETQCQRDGSWDPPVPVCEREVLCVAPEIQHGRQVAGRGPVYRRRDRVSFECDPGYTLDGSRQIECGNDSTWDPPVPVCIQPLPCPPPSVIHHGKHDANPLVAFPSGTYVNYSCEPGYALRGKASIHCTTSGTWSHPSPLCEDGCGAPTRLSFAELRNEYKNQTNFIIGATAKYTCRPGYSRHPGIQPIITCLENRSWSEAPEFCKRKSCGHPGEPMNGRVIVTEIEFGSTVNFTCDEGHRMIGRPFRRCEISGLRVAWSGGLPFCERIPCHPPPDIPNGKHTGVSVDEFSYGSAVTYTCDSGYPLTGEASILCTTEDGRNGVWRPRAPRCGEVRCLSPHILNGRREPGDRRVYSYKDSVTFECDPGYTMKGHRVSQCQTDQTWDPPVPVCEQVTCMSPELENGRTNGALAPYSPGDVAVLECEPGYTLHGSSQPRCQNDGSWDPPVPTCERVTCVSLALENGRTNGALAPYSPGDVAVLECEPGYTLRGSSQPRCQNDGSWDPPVPTCERVTCMSPKLENGRTNGTLAPYSPGDVAVLECEPGYTLRGSSRPRCQNDGSWDPPVPTCERVTCVSPELENGRTNGALAPYSPGDVAVLECEPGYTLRGSSRPRCQNDGSWDPPVPTCERVTCMSPKLENGRTNGALAPYSPGDVAVLECEPGYTLRGSSQPRCQNDGSWDPPVPTCERVTCMSPELENGRTNGALAPYSPGDVAVLECEPGYTLRGSSRPRCQSDGSWDPPVPICEKVGCGVPTRLSFAELKSEYRNQSYFPVGKTANYTCRPGYSKHPAIRPTITCLPNGRWSEPLEFCKRKSCGHPGELENGRINVTDMLFGSMVNFTCEEGHRLIGESSRRCEISGSHVAWSGNMPFCERIPCYPPPDILNGKHNGVLMDDFSYGSTVTYTCDNGYPPTGEASILCTTEDGRNGVWRPAAPRCGVTCVSPELENGRTNGALAPYSPGDVAVLECEPGYTLRGSSRPRCQNDGSWDPPVPTCERVTCVSPELENGRTNGALAPYSPGDVAVLECEPGYTLRGSSRPRCQNDGSWDPPVPTCERVTCMSPELENGRTNGTLAPYRPGDVAVLECEPGYTLRGSSRPRCQNDGSWDPPVSTCERVTCMSPELENGRTNGALAPYSPGDVAVLECEPGYTLRGSSRPRCQSDGSWDPPVPICEKVLNCPSPPLIANGKPSSQALAVFTSGVSVNYSCEPGYSLTGQASIHCTAAGTWSPPAPRCEEVLCKAPEIQHGQQVAGHGPVYRPRDRVNFECDPGYILDGSRQIECRDDATWDPPVPVCIQPIGCGVPTRLSFAELKSEYRNQSYFPVGKTANYTCRPGYSKHPGIRPTITCLPNGRWSEPLEFCKRKSCGHPGELENGRINVTDMLFGSMVNFTCEEGHRLIGESSRRCEISGSHVAWSGDMPFCERIPCYPPPDSPNGKHNGVLMDEFSYGSVVTYTCDNGYPPTGEASILCTTEDGRNGVWRPAAPRCGVTCVSPELENGRTNGALAPYSPGDVAVLECEPGYTLRGSSRPRCQNDGSWDPPVPTCERVTCVSPELENGRTNGALAPYSPGDVAVLECEPGYTLRGSSRPRCQNDGSWDPPVPTCERVTCMSPELENGRTNGTLAPYRPGDVAVLECEPGYTLRGSSRPRCQNDGSWDPPVSTCERVTCVSPELENGRTNGALAPYSPGDVAVLECEPGYTLRGSSRPRCQNDGSWDPPVPTCERVTCMSPELENGRTNGALAPYRPGDVAVLECEPGYTLRGSSRPRCQNDGSWDPPVSTCERVTCMSPELENGRMNGALAPYSPGDVAVLECEPGYTLRGSSRPRCQSDGSWDPPVPICEKVGCGVPTRLSFAELKSEYRNQSYFPVGKTANYTCRPGYSKHPGIRPTITCLPNGRWSEPLEFCKRKSCGHPGELENGRINVTDMLFGSMVNFTCEEGHRLIGESSRRCEISGSHVAWSGDMPFCERIPCYPPPDIPNGKHNGVLMDEFSYGSVVTYTCDNGYPPTGEASILCTTEDGRNGVWRPAAPRCGVTCVSPELENGRTNGALAPYSAGDIAVLECEPGYTLRGSSRPRCQNDGSWDPPVSTCERVTCVSPELENGRTNGALAPYSPGDVAVLECEPGYTLRGSSRPRCQNDGSWDPPVPTCERVTCMSPELENGRTNGALAPYRPGDVAVLECEPGYTLRGSSRPRCQNDGSWDPPVSTCERVTCMSPELENGRTNGALAPYSPGDVAVLECEPGYTLRGSSRPRCQSDGSWDPPVPICEKVLNCPSPPLIANGKPSSQALAVFTSGVSVNYSCEPGYSLTGQASIHCTAAGTWSPPGPRCEEVLCKAPEIQHGQQVAGHGPVYRPRDRVSFECDPGYILDGSRQIECRDDATWDPPVPVCIQPGVFRFLPVGCGVPTRLSFAELKSDYRNQSYFPVGKTANYTCRPGYRKHPAIRPTIACLPNGSWSEPLEFCKRKSCGHPGELENGRINVTDILFGSMVNFTCEEGHRLIGESYRRCEISDSHVAWSGLMPYCERIPCYPPPDIPNGKHNGVLMDDFSYGSAVTYTCDNGYPPTGEASILCTTEDGLNGVWRPAAPRCGEVSCPAPQIENGRREPGQRPVYSYKDSVTFECDPGYTMKGHRVSQCQTDQTWDPPVPVCERVSKVLCMAPEIQHGRQVGGRGPLYRPRDRVTFECDPGYNLDGSRQIECGDDTTWRPPVPVCIQPDKSLLCPPPPVIHHGKHDTDPLAAFPSGIYVNYSCEPGYILRGKASVHCTTSGTWSHPSPLCEVQSSYNFISIEVILGITVGGLLLLVVMIIIIIRRFVTKQNAGYYDPQENHIYQKPGTHVIEQKTSFAP